MQTLEQRAEQLLNDWQALREELEQVHHEAPLAPFLCAQLDIIAVSIATLPSLVASIMPSAIPSGAASTRAILHASDAHRGHQGPGGKALSGFAALVQRARQADADGDI